MKIKIILIALIFNAVFITPQVAKAVDETTTESLIANEYVGGGVAELWSADDDERNYALPFTFNFYGVDYTDIDIGSNGIICLDSSDDCTWIPSSISDNFGPFIAPMTLDLVTSDIYITENSDNVIIRWDVNEFGESDQILFEVVLYENGNIKINYGDNAVASLAGTAIVGISKGDGVDYTASAYNGTSNFDLAQTSAWGSFNPVATSYSPADDSFDVALDSSLAITFDKNVYQGTGDINIKKSGDDSLVEEINAISSQITGWGTNILTVDPSVDFNYYTGYYLNFEADAIKDASDNFYAGISDSSTWNFTTIALSTVIETIPDGECYKLNSAEDSQPSYSTLSYSNNNQTTWSYAPTDSGNGYDCEVTDIRIVYNNRLDSDGEDLFSEFSGTFADTKAVTNGNGELSLDNKKGTYTFGGTEYDYGRSVSTDSSENIFITGSFRGTVDFDPTIGTDTHSASGQDDVFLIKINPDGTYGYTYTLGGAGIETGTSVATDSDGNIFMIGTFNSTNDFDPTAGVDNHSSNGWNDVFLTKINSDGSYGYTYTFGGTLVDSANYVTTDSSGNIFITGSFSDVNVDFDPTAGVDLHSHNGDSDVFLTKINSNGSYGYTYTFGGVGDEGGVSIATNISGDVFMSGDFNGSNIDFDPTAGVDLHSSSGQSDIFLTKINSDGSYDYTYIFGGTWSEYVEENAIDSLGDIYLTGYFYSANADFDPTAGVDLHSSNGQDDIFLTKINADGSYGYTYTFGGTAFDRSESLGIDVDNNIYLTGRFSSDNLDFDPTAGIDLHSSSANSDIFLTKINSDGSYGYTKTMGGNGFDSSLNLDVIADLSKNIYITGRFEDSDNDFDPTDGVDLHSSNGQDDIFLTKINSDGTYGSFSSYIDSGTYQLLISPENNLVSWGNIVFTGEAPTGTTLEYEIFDSSCTTSLISKTDESEIDLSGIDTNNYKQLCLEVTFETTNIVITPTLDKWETTYTVEPTNISTSFDYESAILESDEDDSESDEALSIELYNIKNIEDTSLELRVELENYEDKKLDFKVKVKNLDTGEEYVVKLTKKVSDEGKATLEIEDLIPGTNYSFRVKASEENESDYTDWSNKKKAKTSEEVPSLISRVFIPNEGETSELEKLEKEDEEEEKVPAPTSPGATPQSSLKKKKEDKKLVIEENAMQNFLFNNPILTSVTVASGLVAGVMGAAAASTSSIPFFPLVPSMLAKTLGAANLMARSKKRFGLPAKGEKEKYWGIIFDSYTKQPISEVLVQLFDTKKRRIVDQTVSDENGRYGFLIDKESNYEIRINKGAYKIDASKNKDNLYGDLYTKPIEVKEGNILKLSVALDSQGFNWEKFSRKVISQYSSLTSKLVKYGLDAIYLVGFGISIYAAVIYSGIINYIILFSYLAFLIYRLIKRNQNKFGTIIGKKDKNPLPFTVIELYDTVTNQRVNFTVSDILGRYYLLADNGNYTMKIKSMSHLDGSSFEGQDEITIKSGILKEDLIV